MSSRVVFRSADHAAGLEIADSTVIAPSDRTLHLGSQDLVRVAGFAVANGYELVRFYLGDAYLQPLDEFEELELSRELVELFTRFDDREVVSALNDEYDGLFVVGIELRSRATGHTMLLRTQGYIDTPVKDEATSLLTKAWRKLRLA